LRRYAIVDRRFRTRRRQAIDAVFTIERHYFFARLSLAGSPRDFRVSRRIAPAALRHIFMAASYELVFFSRARPIFSYIFAIFIAPAELTIMAGCLLLPFNAIEFIL